MPTGGDELAPRLPVSHRCRRPLARAVVHLLSTRRDTGSPVRVVHSPRWDLGPEPDRPARVGPAVRDPRARGHRDRAEQRDLGSPSEPGDTREPAEDGRAKERGDQCDDRDDPRGSAAGTEDPERDPARGAERGNEIPEDRQPSRGQRGDVPAERDERVDEGVAPQSAPGPRAIQWRNADARSAAPPRR